MAYFRTLKNGERKLVYTSSDRKKQEQRSYALRGTVRDRRYQKRQLGSKRIRQSVHFFWKYYGRQGVIEELARLRELETMIRARVHATLRYRKTGVWSKHVSCMCDANYERALLAGVQDDIRFYEAVLRNWYN